MVNGWAAAVCVVGGAGASVFSGTWVGGIQDVGSAVGLISKAWSSKADNVSETHRRGTPEDVGGWRCIGGAPEYAGSTPAGVGGGGACVGGS
ncbi:hypothetical protein CRG98_034609 [Punica granatum]|uniref:Secreted protein n=1 Tax=Punica granatum TaxID=22663 RepID=A0A2I0ILW8_PUNGR|nr:hypothetical protein CRG98_034609 [Punica granatum]